MTIPGTPVNITFNYPVAFTGGKYVVTSASNYAMLMCNTWSVKFYDKDNVLLHTDTRTETSWTTNQKREYDITSANINNIRKVVWSIPSEGNEQQLYAKTFLVSSA